jgi:hypothetical protein
MATNGAGIDRQRFFCGLTQTVQDSAIGRVKVHETAPLKRGVRPTNLK